MKKSNFKIVIVFSIILGIFLGFVTDIYEISITSYIIPILILIIIFIVIASAYFLFKEARHQQKLLNSGRYDELIKHLSDKHQRLKGKMGYNEQYLVNIANCYIRMGKFQESLNLLEEIKNSKMDKKLKALYDSLIAADLYFLNSDFRRAEELIIKSRQSVDMPESILLQALIAIELDKKDNAEQLIEQYYKWSDRKKYVFNFNTALIFDEYSTEISEKFMLGLYYNKIGNIEKSNEYFSISAMCNYDNYFSKVSKELSNQ